MSFTELRRTHIGTGISGDALHVWCPACDDNHQVFVRGDEGFSEDQIWEWDGNRVTPTITPSIACHYGDQPGHRVCHSFLRAGKWEFLADCTHALAGKTGVAMVEIPEDFVFSGDKI